MSEPLKAVTLVEIDIPRCTRTYGVAPCTAFEVGSFVVAQEWVFDNVTLSWVPANANFTAAPGGAVLLATGGDPILQSPVASMALDGSVNFIVRVDLTRTVARSGGATYQRAIYYSTSGHGFTGSFFNQFALPEPQVGERVTIEADMRTLGAGGTDWIDSTIQRIRLDFDNGGSGGSEFIIHAVYIGHYAVEGEATGAIKCFNCLSTCQDRENYLAEDETVRFAVPNPELPMEMDARPFIKGQPSYTPATISLGKDLGVRATLQVSFQDAPDPDTGAAGDRYVTERVYNPFEQGTFFGKFRARFPFVRGVAVRLIRGELGQAVEDMRTYHFVGDSFDGPRPDGTFAIFAKDVLKLADNDRALCPAPSEGTLLAGISDVDTIAEMPSGEAALYPGEGIVCIGGNEVCRYVRGDGGLDANVVLLLSFDGPNNSQTPSDFDDESSNNFVPSLVLAQAKLSTTQKKFGTASLRLDGLSTGALVYADAAAWAFGTGNFTIDAQIRPDAIGSDGTIWCHGNNEANLNNSFRFAVTSTGALTIAISSGGSTLLSLSSAAGVITAGVWQHVAVVRDTGNVWKLYVNGVEVATSTTSLTSPNYTGNMRIGNNNNNGGAPFVGYIDELRVSSVARWSDDFTPPDGPYNSATVDDLQLTERGAFNTVARAHNAEERVQLCKFFDGLEPDLIIAELFKDFAGIDASLIDDATWAAESDAYLQRVYTALITEPTGVNQLVSELILEAALSVWYDPESRQLQYRVLRNVSPTAEALDDDRYLAGTLSTKEQPETRISQVHAFYARRNPTRPLSDQDNYASMLLRVDADSEFDNGSSKIERVFCRWVPEFGSAIVDRVADIKLGRFKTPPRKFQLAFGRGAEPEGIAPGQSYYLQAPTLQDATGARALVPMQITRVDPQETRFVVEAEEATFSNLDPVDLFNRTIIIDANAFNLDIAALHDTLYPEITDPYGITLTITVQPGVTVGSLDRALPAMDIGLFPLGLAITLRLLGRIQGKGGQAASVGQSGDSDQYPAEAGGTALYTRQAITLDLNGDGELWAGGGGGGAYYNNTFYPTSPFVNNQVEWLPGGSGAGTRPGDPGVQEGRFKPLGGANWTVCDATAATDEAGGVASTASPTGNRGGDGGGPGLAGAAASGGSSPPGRFLIAPGAAGAAIDGDSFVTISVAGDLRGTQVN